MFVESIIHSSQHWPANATSLQGAYRSLMLTGLLSLAYDNAFIGETGWPLLMLNDLFKGLSIHVFLTGCCLLRCAPSRTLFDSIGCHLLKEVAATTGAARQRHEVTTPYPYRQIQRKATWIPLSNAPWGPDVLFRTCWWIRQAAQTRDAEQSFG